MADQTWSQLMDQAEESTGFDPIPGGVYSAYVESAQYKKAGTGRDMIEAVFVIYGDPNYQGRRVWNNFVLTEDNPRALGIFKRHMAALGIHEDQIRALPEPTDVGMSHLASMLVNQFANIRVAVGDYGGGTNDVKDVKPYSPVPASPGGVPGAPSPAPAPAPQPAPAPAPAPAPVAPAPQAPAPAPAPAPAAPPPQPGGVPPAQPQGAPPAPAPQPGGGAPQPPAAPPAGAPAAPPAPAAPQPPGADQQPAGGGPTPPPF